MKAESAPTERAETGLTGSPALDEHDERTQPRHEQTSQPHRPLSPSHSRTLRSGLTFIVSSDRALDYMRLKVNGGTWVIG